MKQKQLVLSPRALDDLAGIYAYIARENSDAAVEFVNDLTAKIEWIAKTRYPGAARDWIRPGLRALPYRNRCIYFRIKGDSVHIVRVLHGKQDVIRQDL